MEAAVFPPTPVCLPKRPILTKPASRARRARIPPNSALRQPLPSSPRVKGSASAARLCRCAPLCQISMMLRSPAWRVTPKRTVRFRGSLTRRSHWTQSSFEPQMALGTRGLLPDCWHANYNWSRGEIGVKRILGFLLITLSILSGSAAVADDYSDTVALFKNAGESAAFFNDCYGYAVFPTIGKGGLVVGGAYGKGRVYEHGKYVGDTSMTQLSVGLQAGGQAYSMIIFFQDRRAFEEFTRENFEFGADVSAVAITAAASGQLGTTGASAGASGGKKDATTAGNYYKGLAVFTIAKGGAMVQAAVAGQKFTYKPKAAS